MRQNMAHNAHGLVVAQIGAQCRHEACVVTALQHLRGAAGRRRGEMGRSYLLAASWQDVVQLQTRQA